MNTSEVEIAPVQKSNNPLLIAAYCFATCGYEKGVTVGCIKGRVTWIRGVQTQRYSADEGQTQCQLGSLSSNHRMNQFDYVGVWANSEMNRK